MAGGPGSPEIQVSIRTYEDCARTKRRRSPKSGGLARRRIAPNTYLEPRENETFAIRFHATDIVTYAPDGSIVLDSGGWRTMTTRARMRDCSPFELWQERGIWYVADAGARPRDKARAAVFADGMRWDGKRWQGIGESPKRQHALARRIAKYAADYSAALMAGDVGAPSAGDCFYCAMTVQGGADDGRGLGEAMRDDSHMRSHMAESYFVPSILHRACERFGASQMTRGLIGELWRGKSAESLGRMAEWLADDSRKLVRRYVREQCGLPA